MIESKSEIRGVFIHEAIFGGTHDWNLIAQTCAQYKIDAVFVNVMGLANSIHNEEELPSAIEAFHSRGIEYHAVMNVLGDMAINSEVETVDHTGARNGWNCPIKIRPIVKQTAEKIATYNIDGFMFDYIRYNSEDMCYCSECKKAFQQWLGETITDWTPFYPGGSRHNEFMEWRTIPVTELVRDIRNWMLAINPKLKFSAAVWTLFDDAPTYWRYWLGQDSAYWIAQGYIDFVAPMMYTTQLTGDPESIEAYFRECNKYFTGGPEGKVPLAPFITVGWDGFPVTVGQFVNVVNKLRSLGADGWIIFAYGGPGAWRQYGYPDIRNYLSPLSLPDTFSLENIQISRSQTQATVAWTTNLPSTSIVEYSPQPLFTASYKVRDNFHFWDVDHIPGSIIQDSALVTNHSITLKGLSPGTGYYLRIQSQDPSGIATSPVYYLTEQPGNITPWTQKLEEGTYRITMPSQVQVGSDIYNFKRWEDGSTNPVRTINLTTDMTITATYEKVVPITYTLIISARAGGTTNPPPGSYTLSEGTQQTVTAIPNANYRFVNWLLDGIARTENPITVTMDKDHTLEAVFEYVSPPPLTATIKGIVTDETTGLPVAGATVTCNGYVDVTEVDGSYIFDSIPAQRYTLKVTKAGYREERFSVDASAGGTFTVDISISPITHTLTIIARAGGTTNPSPGIYTIVEGQRQQVTAIPSANYKFAYWLLDGVTRTENPITVTMDADHILEAVFEYVPPPPQPATISGTVKDPAGNPIAGAVVTCDGYADVTETDGSYIIADIPAKPYTLTVTKEGYQTKTIPVDLSAGGTYTLDITLTPTPTPKPPPTVVGPLGVWRFPILTWIIEFIRRIRGK